MIIEPNEQRWSISSEGPWQLIFNDQHIIKLFQTTSGTSTQEKLFVGTKEECDAKVEELSLPLATKDALGDVQEDVPIMPPLPEDDTNSIF